MQIAVAEFARNVAAMDGANSTEFDLETEWPVIDLLPEQKEVSDLGGTMRLGADPVKVHDGTAARRIYGEAVIYERHRHRYEVSISLRKRLEHAGLGVSGTSPDERLVEMIELPDHPFFVASQFHPEFKSRPERPAPLFREFVHAALERAVQNHPEGDVRASRAAERRARRDFVRPASQVERRRLGELFAELCAIPSPFGHERAIADRVTAELRSLGLEVVEDELPRRPARGRVTCWRASARGARAIPSSRSAPTWTRCPTATWRSSPCSSTVAGRTPTTRSSAPTTRRPSRSCWRLRTAARWRARPLAWSCCSPSARRTRWSAPRRSTSPSCAAEIAYVFDHASPIGEVVVASPTYYRVEAAFHGKAAHAGIRPEDGRSAILAASRAIATMRLGRLDDETTTNVGTIHGGVGGTNVVPERCTLLAEARSLSSTSVEDAVAEIVDHCHDAANDPECECDLDVTMERLFEGYRHKASAPAVVAAEAALRTCGYTPRRILSGGGSDANAFEARGLHCANLANGTERNHEPTERVSVAALEGMLDVTFGAAGSAGGLNSVGEDWMRRTAPSSAGSLLCVEDGARVCR